MELALVNVQADGAARQALAAAPLARLTLEGASDALLGLAQIVGALSVFSVR